MPLKGKSGIGRYFTKDEFTREEFGFLLGNKQLNITLPTEDKGAKKMVTKDGITTLNTYLKATGLVAESAELKKGEHDVEYFEIAFKKDTTTPGKGTGTDQAAKTDAKIVDDLKNAIGALSGSTTTAVPAISTASTTPITNNTTLIAAIKGTTSATVVTINGAFPGDLHGATVTLTSVASITDVAQQAGNVVLTITKGKVTTTATFTITHS